MSVSVNSRDCSGAGHFAWKKPASLEAIEATDSAADEETQGILAGAYKRLADADPARRDEWLQVCQAKYGRLAAIE